MKLYKRNEVLRILNINYKTLYKMALNGEIETVKIGGMQMYHLEKFLRCHNLVDVKEDDKVDICYCRVSSRGQKDDLKRQVEWMKSKYPNNVVLTDVGSGLNFKRKNLQKLIKLAIEGNVRNIIVAYKDRLARIGFELIEWIIKEYSGGSIIVVNKNEEETPTEELTKDIITIMNVYVAKVNGLRKYKVEMTDKIKNERGNV